MKNHKNQVQQTNTNEKNAVKNQQNNATTSYDRAKQMSNDQQKKHSYNGKVKDFSDKDDKSCNKNCNCNRDECSSCKPCKPKQ